MKLAQLNIARLDSALDSLQLEGFVARLDEINHLADKAEGFIWRYISDGTDSEETAAQLFGPDIIVTLSVWDNIKSAHTFVYRSAHAQLMAQRGQWFQCMKEAYMVLWWVPQGHIPTLVEAQSRLSVLRQSGPCAQAFTFKSAYPANGVSHQIMAE